MIRTVFRLHTMILGHVREQDKEQDHDQPALSIESFLAILQHTFDHLKHPPLPTASTADARASLAVVSIRHRQQDPGRLVIAAAKELARILIVQLIRRLIPVFGLLCLRLLLLLIVIILFRRRHLLPRTTEFWVPVSKLSVLHRDLVEHVVCITAVRTVYTGTRIRVFRICVGGRRRGRG